MIITKVGFELIKSKEELEVFSLKVDFGTREVKALKQGNYVIIDEDIRLEVDKNLKGNFCYLIENEGLRKICFFSSTTNRFYKLVPTSDWPTFSISSVPMHKLSSPKKDTQNKIDFLKPFGYVLDTCMGLGYTAILASKTAKKIITFEKDENVFVLAKINPLSKELFRAANIEIRNGDINKEVVSLRDAYFDCVIHDPPTYKMAGELFSKFFYHEIRRILKAKGRLFHYTPLYKIKQGYNFPAKVRKSLKEVGFNNIQYSERVGGFLCQK